MQNQISAVNLSNLSALILCGGAARRLDGEDKGLMKAKGKQNKPLIERQIDILKPQVRALSISANRNLPTYKSYGYPVYQDKTGEQFDGPLQGILKGLKECQTDWLYIQPIDTPNLPANGIQQFIDRVRLNGSSSFYLVTEKRAHYLHLLLHRSCYDSLKSFVDRNERRVKAFVKEINAEPINLGWQEDAFKNLNDIEEYEC